MQKKDDTMSPSQPVPESEDNHGGKILFADLL
jgi:hypothetical protein